MGGQARLRNGVITVVERFVQRAGTAELVRVRPLRDVLGDQRATVDQLRTALDRAITGMEVLLEELAARPPQRQPAHSRPYDLTPGEAAAAVALLTALPTSVGKVRVYLFAEQVGVSRATLDNAIAKLRTHGVIATRSCGPGGTEVRVLDPGALGKLQALVPAADDVDTQAEGG